ncbi:MAG: ATP-dependent DNA helicase RecQ [Aldersonia sp.]|nr:ATP-dependent DNA helicase RecQ [Aldersonia sp.]
MNELETIAEQTFGWPTLRPEQLEAMQALLAGRDVLAVMATGSGKSAIYQLPAVLVDGATVVVSPLIALQEDQIAGLADTNAPEAVAINSALGADESAENWRDLRARAANYVFLTPEQLATEDVVAKLERVQVALFVVDEAHCISDWGQDFRPDYLRLPDVVDRIGRPPVAALTATASPPVRQEIVERLRLREPAIVAGGFDRPNLRLVVDQHIDDADKRAAVVETAAGLPQPGLIYTATRKDAERYAAALAERGLRTAFYHAGLAKSRREEVHEGFRDGAYDVVAATSAFGMGIDKPDVRFVLNASVPESIDTYYQQMGRAGRDGEPAEARLFYRAEDLSLGKYFTTRRPDPELLRRVHAALDTSTPKRLTDLASKLDLTRRRVTQAVNILEQAHKVTAGPRGFVRTDDDSDAAVERALDLAAARQRFDRTRIEMMRRYAEIRSCRRQFLLGYFGENLPEPCGNCDRCLAHDDATPEPEQESAIPVDTDVEHEKWGHGIVLSGDSDEITVLFDDYGYRNLSVAAVRERNLLRVL